MGWRLPGVLSTAATSPLVCRLTIDRLTFTPPYAITRRCETPPTSPDPSPSGSGDMKRSAPAWSTVCPRPLWPSASATRRATSACSSTSSGTARSTSPSPCRRGRRRYLQPLGHLKAWSRLGCLLPLPLSVAAAYGTTGLLERLAPRSRGLVGCLLVAGVLADQVTWPRRPALERPTFDVTMPWSCSCWSWTR